MSVFCRTFVGNNSYTALTPTPTAIFQDEIIPIKRKPLMENIEAIKTILEIIVIFISFPQYAPFLATIFILGFLYQVLKEDNTIEK
ncbi:MAG TPA: hypothetical protein DEG17_20415 [Cyanobacteria bacterium UBA11149]|nr:hypothetical protein [Cyanobacteria bacterium UBA11366]HBK64507.1 hypothetical protein [Cyanobacteria bacterium UBA11166]HBR75811.1 hypothetical protein [Cyanobacteria bacterium UBA11159]HBS72326.1 hypothetical protein [Cyanobacteria bacterium UBA11153]HBW91160.1 hypothetical protein [Cyanobacteria bacterium UBA11149]HCA94378.1 hypothetical protein [Cyanobacteria bacterium UBA9226]